jgi:RNA polymerase sigma-70 factor (ECF subfamily)
MGRGERVVQHMHQEALREAAGDRDRLSELLDPLARDAAAGSPEALEVVVWAVDELGLARSAIRQLLVDEADVEEVTQDVLVAVAETVDGFRGEARFTTWLHQVARFKAIAFLRRRRETAALPSDDPAGDAQRISSMIATRASIDEVLRQLPEEYREPVVLRDVQQLPYDQLAERLALNVNTAKTRVARGRALVAARLRTAGG